MNKYKRLTLEEREEISRLLSQGYSPSSIAKRLKRATSTITREIKKGGCNKYTYRAGKAERRAKRNSSKRKKGIYKLVRYPQLKQYI